MLVARSGDVGWIYSEVREAWTSGSWFHEGEIEKEC